MGSMTADRQGRRSRIDRYDVASILRCKKKIQAGTFLPLACLKPRPVPHRVGAFLGSSSRDPDGFFHPIGFIKGYDLLKTRLQRLKHRTFTVDEHLVVFQ